ncbi:MAG TPA: PKD domain-containing protein, partial [Nocardioides sp.]|nr:PKD domain-containing protein [Nocardioides sp.]
MLHRVALALVLLVSSVTSAVLVGGGVLATASNAVVEGRTWVVDAVDDASGNRWESVDTGTSVVTIAVGDTVEWHFDRATQGHDLISLAPAGQWEDAWQTPLSEYRDAGGEPVRRTFTEPGTYRYECSLHGPTMSGTVVVTDVGDNRSPTASPVVEPLAGDAPLVVHATANADDPDGDVPTVSWEPGDGGPVAHVDHAMLEYRTPGQYVARLRVSDGRGGLLVREFPVTVTGEGDPPDPEPPAGGALPAIDALAAPAPGTLGVAFSTQVTTRGPLVPYSVGLTSHPDLAGEAVLVRRRGGTETLLRVTGADPGTAHPSVHVHERACADALGGAHFRFDTTKPFAEPNEIWPTFTTDASGDSGPVRVVKPLRAGPGAVSVVVHDPADASRRIGCADLLPVTADLAYAWTFGDGTTGSGADPDHTYAAAGTYTATVTVSHGSGTHAGHGAVSDSVQVVVGGGTPPVVVAPVVVPPVVAPPADHTGPRISSLRPTRTTSARRPVVRARVVDAGSGVRPRSVVLLLDGRRVR